MTLLADSIWSDDQIESANSADLNVPAVFSRDDLNIVSDIFTGFTVLLDTRSPANDSIMNFKSLFSAKIGELLLQDKTIRLEESLLSLLQSTQPGAEDSRKTSVLATASTSHGRGTAQGEWNASSISKIEYDSIASARRQNDKTETSEQSSQSYNTSENIVTSSGSTFGSKHGGRQGSWKEGFINTWQ